MTQWLVSLNICWLRFWFGNYIKIQTIVENMWVDLLCNRNVYSGFIVFVVYIMSGSHSAWDSPSKNTGVGSHSLLHGIFPTLGSNPDLLHFRQILYCLSHQQSPCWTKWESYWENFKPYEVRIGSQIPAESMVSSQILGAVPNFPASFTFRTKGLLTFHSGSSVRSWHSGRCKNRGMCA